MNWPLYLIIFAFGLAVGSFLNVVIYRSQSGEYLKDGEIKKRPLSFLYGRSYCPSCKHQLYWPDLIPLFSFFALGRKCRYCKKPISWQYPLVEFFTGIIFLLALIYELRIMNYTAFGVGLIIYSLFIFLISSLLIVIFVSDLKTYIIPDGVVYSAIAISIVYDLFYPLLLVHDPKLILQYLFSSVGAAGFFLLIFLVSRGKWMGFGDVKLAVLMGLFLGYPNILLALFLAFFIGAIIGVATILAGRKKLSSEIPFGPFLVLGTFIALFWGQSIISWYLNSLIF